MLLIHGGGFDTAAISWFELIADLGTQRPVWAPDLPGFGGSRAVPVLGSAADIADQLAALLTQLPSTDKVIVCGVSMGGEVALQFGLRHPDRTEAIVAIAPGGLIGRFGGPVMHWLTWLMTRLPDVGMNLVARGSAYRAERTLCKVVRRPLPQVVIDEWVAEAQRPGAGVAYGAYNRNNFLPRRMTNNLLPYLTRLTPPTLFFHGQDDPIVPIQGSVTAASLVPDGRIVQVPHCGHWAHLECPDAFLTTWREFIDHELRA